MAFGRVEGQAINLTDANGAGFNTPCMVAVPALLDCAVHSVRSCGGQCSGKGGCLGNELFMLVSHVAIALRFGCTTCVLPLLGSRLQRQGIHARGVEMCPAGTAARTVAAQVGASAAARTYGRPAWAAVADALRSGAGGHAVVSFAPYLQNRRFFEQPRLLRELRAALGFTPAVAAACTVAEDSFRASHRAARLVTLHVRGGDYLELGKPPPVDHYVAAVRAARHGGSSLCALIISNDRAYVRRHLLGPLREVTGGCAELADTNTQVPDALDMCLCSRGDVVVIGGGSFGFFCGFMAKESAIVHASTRQFLFGSPLHGPLEYYLPHWRLDAKIDLRLRL